MLIQFFSFDIAFANTFFTAIGSTVNFASRLEDTYSIKYYAFFVFAIDGDIIVGLDIFFLPLFLALQ